MPYPTSSNSRPVAATKPTPYGAPTQHAPHGLGGAVPAWFHQLEPGVRRTYERLLHDEMDAKLSFEAAKDIMDRTYGRPVTPVATQSHATVDHRHMHLTAMQAFNGTVDAATPELATLSYTTEAVYEVEDVTPEFLR